MHAAAVHTFELGLFINACDGAQPENPVHVGAGTENQRQWQKEKSRNPYAMQSANGRPAVHGNNPHGKLEIICATWAEAPQEEVKKWDSCTSDELQWSWRFVCRQPKSIGKSAPQSISVLVTVGQKATEWWGNRTGSLGNNASMYLRADTFSYANWQISTSLM